MESAKKNLCAIACDSCWLNRFYRKEAADVEHCLGNISTGNHFIVTYD